jgi:hypothetical protein
MKRFILVGVLGLLGGMPAMAKETPPTASKEPSKTKEKDPQSGTIKDEEALKCIQTRLEEQTGSKGWKIELKDLAGTARDFVATNGQRSEKGTVNVSKAYPNQGALRVYLVPND